MSAPRWVVLAAGLPVLTVAAAVGVLWRAIDGILPTDPFDVFDDCADDWADFHAGGDGTHVRVTFTVADTLGVPSVAPLSWATGGPIHVTEATFGAHPTVPPRVVAFTVTEGEQVLTAQQWRERPAP